MVDFGGFFHVRQVACARDEVDRDVRRQAFGVARRDDPVLYPLDDLHREVAEHG